MMTIDEVLDEAKARWSTPPARERLIQKYKCTPLYIAHILTGNKKMPRWMISELGYERVVEVTYRKREEHGKQR